MRRFALEVALLDALGELDLLELRQQRVAADLLQEELQRVGRALDHEALRCTTFSSATGTGPSTSSTPWASSSR